MSTLELIEVQNGVIDNIQQSVYSRAHRLLSEGIPLNKNKLIALDLFSDKKEPKPFKQ